jgi:hypothetical protein
MYKLNTKANKYGSAAFIVVDNKHRTYMTGNTAACATCVPMAPSIRGSITMAAITDLSLGLTADGYTGYDAGSIEEANKFMAALAQ